MWCLVEILMKALRMVSDFTAKKEIWESVFNLSLLLLLSSNPYLFGPCFLFNFTNFFACHSLTCLPPTFHRCGSKQGEEDYRPLFENFVQDLLSTVNKPEWPAAELLLSLLGRLLVSMTSLLNQKIPIWQTLLTQHFTPCVCLSVLIRFTSSVTSRRRWLWEWRL